MSAELTPEQSAKLAVDGIVLANGAFCIESSDDPRDLTVGEWLEVQRLHIAGDEAGLLQYVRAIKAAAMTRPIPPGSEDA